VPSHFKRSLHKHTYTDLFNDIASSFTETRSIAQAIRGRPLTAETRLQSQNNPRGQIATGDKIFSKYLTRSLIFHQRPILH